MDNLQNSTKLTPITMSAEREAELRSLVNKHPGSWYGPDLLIELDAERAAHAKTRERLVEVSQKWLNAASEVDELLPIKAERDSLREQLAEAQRDTERLDWLTPNFYQLKAILPLNTDWWEVYTDFREWVDDAMSRDTALRTKPDKACPCVREDWPDWDHADCQQCGGTRLHSAESGDADCPLMEKTNGAQSELVKADEAGTKTMARKRRSI